MSDVLVETAVFEVFAKHYRELDLLIIGNSDMRLSAHDLKEYMIKFEVAVHQGIKDAYKAWYLTEHEVERRDITLNPTKTEGE